MIISKIRMKNFRGFVDKEIDFDDKPVVLLHASNGTGKTTVVDAIEWCLTGDIGRLKTAFTRRSSNNSERAMNTNGILKYSGAGSDEYIDVSLWLKNGEDESVLRRVQKEDALDKDSSKFTLDGNEQEAERFLKEYIGESFYNYHFCDVQKSFNMQSEKRGNLEELFSEFITNYDDKKRIAINLEIFADDVSRYIEDQENKKVSQDVISSYESQLEKLREEARQITYPSVSFFEGEKTDVTGLAKEDLIKQRTEIERIGYSAAEELLTTLCKNDELKREKKILDSILTFRRDNKAEIQKAKQSGLLEDNGIVSKIEEKLNEVKSLQFDRESIIEECESHDLFRREEGSFIQFLRNKEKVLEKEEALTNIKEEITLLTNNNKVLGLMSKLAANKEVFVDFRNSERKNGNVKCPVCGSETFSTMEEALILKEADEYISKNGELVKKKQIEKNRIESEIETLYQEIIDSAKGVVNKEILELETKISSLQTIQEKLKPYYELVEKLKAIESKVTSTELNDDELELLSKSVEGLLLNEAEIEESKRLYQKILSVLGYQFENETMKQICAKVSGLANGECNLEFFTYDDFVNKINAIDNIVANRSIQDIEEKLKDAKTRNQEADNKIEALKKIQEEATKRATKIESIVEELTSAEYENVGPALKNYYNKLVRVDNNVGINTIHEKDGISLVDDNGKNIVNVLSNGQICVFMLAFFFAGISARKEEKMKVFFIDDLTACMDDVNMLSFMDLLKYQMDAKETIEQLFFATCDERISSLFEYKMSGRKIELQEITESDLMVYNETASN